MDHNTTRVFTVSLTNRSVPHSEPLVLARIKNDFREAQEVFDNFYSNIATQRDEGISSDDLTLTFTVDFEEMR